MAPQRWLFSAVAILPLAGAALARPQNRLLQSPSNRRTAAIATNALVRPLRRDAGWFLAYADLRPFDETSLESQLFLATNLGFFVVGAFAATAGAPGLGVLCEAAGTASCWYHYAQVAQPKTQPFPGTNHPSVQLALLVDYACAIATLVAGLAYAAELGPTGVPPSAVAYALGAVGGLAGGWFFEKPREYMALHGAWHVLSAAAGGELVAAHAALGAGT